MAILKIFFILAVCLSCSCASGGENVDIIQHENEMSKSMELHALATIFTAINDFKNDSLSIANYVKNEFNSKYGKNWICLVGRVREMGIGIEAAPQTLLWI